jgi:predicted regulator of Ras-like GTPase activity (Roadblock/LC7/MglB family)
MITETLTGLRDVDEVQGSFLLAGGGELVARDLPAVFHSEIFGEIGPRLVRLRETLESNGGDLASLTLRFAEHKLHIRAVGALLLGVVTSAKVNGPALRMAINLVTRRVAGHAGELKPEVAALAPGPPSKQEQASERHTPMAPPVGTQRGAGVAGRADISFRGRKF